MPPNETKSVTSRTEIEKPPPTPGDLFASQPHVQRLINQIVLTADDRIDKYISAAERLKRLRAYFDAAPDLGETWFEWALHHLPSKDKNLPGLLQRIAEAPSRKAQERILRIHLDNARARQKRFRDKQRESRVARIKPGWHRKRTAIILWARDADLNNIHKVWKYISARYPTDPNHQPRMTKPRKAKSRERKTNV